MVSVRLGILASQSFTITPGLPQGSALSPVTFNVYKVDITSNQLKDLHNTFIFADDGLVVVTV